MLNIKLIQYNNNIIILQIVVIYVYCLYKLCYQIYHLNNSQILNKMMLKN